MEKPKEPIEVRKERIRMAKALSTKSEKNPKAYDRKKISLQLLNLNDSE